MPAANAVRTTPTAKRNRHLRPRDVGRADRFTGFMSQPLLPNEFERRGRIRILAAFRALQKRDGVTGPPATLARIPEGNVRVYELAIAMLGVSPVNAGALMFGVCRNTVHHWIEEGRDEACKDPMKREFFLRTERAKACGLALAENSVFNTDPLNYLRYGPTARTTSALPGWTPQTKLLHTDPTGEGAPHFELEVTVGGFKTHAQPQLEAGDE